MVVSGDYKVDDDPTLEGQWQGQYADFLRLRTSIPALTLMTPPAGTPTEVVEAIESASKVLWTDPNSAANRLRFAIKSLLTALGQRRYTRSKPNNGAPATRRRLTTHARIAEYRKDHTEAGDALLAVKWIGNSGSHDSQLTVSNVLDGADMLAYALRLIYDKSDETMRRRIAEVNKRKGLPAKRPTKKAAKKAGARSGFPRGAKLRGFDGEH